MYLFNTYILLSYDQGSFWFSDKKHVVEFDFLGKDSIRYHNLVGVEKRVFRNVGRFMENKKGADDLFDRLNTSILNEYLNGLMPGLTAKVFRTYNASITLQEQLNELTDADDNVVAKVNSFTIFQPGLITIITLFCLHFTWEFWKVAYRWICEH